MSSSKISLFSLKAERLRHNTDGEDIHFFGKNEYDEELKIDIKSLPEEVILDITHFDGVKDETYLHSNAFIFDDPGKVYYFNSHQIITTTPKEKNLGKVVDISIQLRHDNCKDC